MSAIALLETGGVGELMQDVLSMAGDGRARWAAAHGMAPSNGDPRAGSSGGAAAEDGSGGRSTHALVTATGAPAGGTADTDNDDDALL